MRDKDIFWNSFSKDIGRWPGDILSSGHTHSIETFSWEDLRSHLSIVSFIYFIIFYFIIYLYTIGWTYRCQERGDETPAQHPPVFEGDEGDAAAKHVTGHQFDVIQKSEDS